MARNLFEYHPVLGYRFIPGLRARVRHEGGGYLVRCNRAGFRCEREATPAAPEGRLRILLFGDSYTAGEGVSNRFRFGDLLEAELPGVEVLNFGLPGSGTDQQYLAWRELGRPLAHDLLLLCPMVENVRRNGDSHRLTWSAADGRLVWRAKPFFRLEEGGGLTLHHQPVPKRVWPADEPPPGAAAPASPSAARSAWRGLGATLDARVPGILAASRRLRGVRWPADYEDPAHPGWRLLRAILTRWVRESAVPVVIAPIPTFAHVRKEARADGVRRRFAELGAELAVPVVDVLPALWRHPARLRRAARFPTDDHPTRLGHRLLAEALLPELAAHLPRRRQAA